MNATNVSGKGGFYAHRGQGSELAGMLRIMNLARGRISVQLRHGFYETHWEAFTWTSGMTIVAEYPGPSFPGDLASISSKTTFSACCRSFATEVCRLVLTRFETAV